MTADLALLASDPTSLDVYDDPGKQIVLACERANAWLKAGIEVRIELIVETKAQRIEGGICAVGTLVRAYKRSGPKTLQRALRIIRDAYGSAGLDAPVIDGITWLCDRYNGDLDDDHAVEKLSKMLGGVSGLVNKAYTVRNQTGQPLGQALAAAAVDVINAGLAPRSGKRLPSWFREDAA